MNTKLPLLALLLGSALGATAQKTVKTVPLKPEMKPYTWVMKPAAEFFSETGLAPEDSVWASTYRIGPEKGAHVLAEVGHIDAINADVIWWVKYVDFKEKDLKLVGSEISETFSPQRSGENSFEYYTPDAYVSLEVSGSDDKVANLTLDVYPLYKFMPPIEDALAKTDSTWQQLIGSPTFKERSIVRDSAKVQVRINKVTPLVSYAVFYPFDANEKPYVAIELNDGGGYEVLKWATKRYYDRFFDSFDGGTIYVADTDQPWVRLGVLFDRGELLNLYMSQADFQDWALSDAEE
jgi:hypothetical protein